MGKKKTLKHTHIPKVTTRQRLVFKNSKDIANNNLIKDIVCTDSEKMLFVLTLKKTVMHKRMILYR